MRISLLDRLGQFRWPKSVDDLGSHHILTHPVSAKGIFEQGSIFLVVAELNDGQAHNKADRTLTSKQEGAAR